MIYSHLIRLFLWQIVFLLLQILQPTISIKIILHFNCRSTEDEVSAQEKKLLNGGTAAVTTLFLHLAVGLSLYRSLQGNVDNFGFSSTKFQSNQSNSCRITCSLGAEYQNKVYNVYSIIIILVFNRTYKYITSLFCIPHTSANMGHKNKKKRKKKVLVDVKTSFYHSILLFLTEYLENKIKIVYKETNLKYNWKQYI